MLPEGADNGVYGASTAQAVLTFQQWVNKQRDEEILEVTSEIDPLTSSYLHYCRQNNLHPNVESVEMETPVTNPSRVSPPEKISISIADMFYEGSVLEVGDDSFTVSWSADVEVEDYTVYVTDSAGNTLTSVEDTRSTSFRVDSKRMQPGVVYTVSVGAIPQNDSIDDVIWISTRFTLAAEATFRSTITAEPTEKSTTASTEAKVSRPFVSVGGAGYQSDSVQYMTDSTIMLCWGAEGSVDGYIVYVENENGERQNLGTTTDTSRTISTDNLPSGIYTVYVGAILLYGTEDDALWGTACFSIPTVTTKSGKDESLCSINNETDSRVIEQLQMQLYRLGMLADQPETGILDNATLSAVADFQKRVNDMHNAGLNVIDPSDPNIVIDVETLRWLERGL